MGAKSDDGPPAGAGVRRRALRLAVAVALPGMVVLSCSIAPRPQIPGITPPGAGAEVPVIDVEAPGRSAQQLEAWAAGLGDAMGMPVTALEAYGYGEAVMRTARPDCHLRWTTLAGIGSVESGHGTHGGARPAPDGTVSPPIRGVALDGSTGVEDIPDTDGGALDGDPVHDRAMGPMQFIPETWQRWGVDANGDGVADPDNIDDAVLTAARYLCAHGRDLATPQGWRDALYSYNRSDPYAREVAARANAYSVGVRP